MWGRLNPHLGWRWRDPGGEWNPYVFADISRYAGMISGRVEHSGVLTARPVPEFDLLSLDGSSWYPVSDLIKEVPVEKGPPCLTAPIPSAAAQPPTTPPTESSSESGKQLSAPLKSEP